MNKNWDVIIVGGGPAGSIAAIAALNQGVSVLMLEKKSEIGIPVKCAEAVNIDKLSTMIAINERWIINKIKYIKLISPNKHEVKLNLKDKDTYAIIDRKLFDYDLAKYAALKGATVLTNAFVYDINLSKNGIVNGVKAIIDSNEVKLNAKIVIAADGVESKIGRLAGLNTNIEAKDLMSCVQANITNIDITEDKQTLCFLWSKKYAPGGYIWIFSHDDNTANIGVGISTSTTNSNYLKAKDYFNMFIKSNYLNPSILKYNSGAVTRSVVKTISKIGLMLVGDAARIPDTLFAEGLVSGMQSGLIAGNIAAKSIINNDFTEKIFKEYENEVLFLTKDKDEIYNILRKKIESMDDEQLDKFFQNKELIRSYLSD